MNTSISTPAQQQWLENAVNLTRQIDRLEQSPRRDRLKERLAQLHQKLATCTHDIVTHPGLIEDIPADIRQDFVQAIALLPLYQRLNPNHNLTGTWKSTTLPDYRQDSMPAHWSTQPFLHRISQRFQLSDAAVERIHNQVDKADTEITACTRVIQSIRQQFNQLQTDADSQALLYALVGEDLAIPAAAIATVATQTQIIFLLDYEEQQLRCSESWQVMPPSQQSRFQQFLQAMTEFEFSQFANFPTFGKFGNRWLSPKFCQSLSARTGVSFGRVVRILQQAIGLVQMSKAESFLIHDICGHGWQHLLTQFGGDYAILSLANHPLTPGLTAYTTNGPLTLREVVQFDGHRVHIQPDLARQFFHGEVTQRLAGLFTHLTGEMLADFHEFKWVWQNQADIAQMPSSSAFKTLPAKLDLGILDVEFLFDRVFAPLLALEVNPQHDSLLEQTLLVEWGRFDRDTRCQLKHSLLQLHQLFWQEYLSHYQPRCTSTHHEFGQIINNMLYVQNTCNSLYSGPWAQVNDRPFQDLMSLFIGVFCSLDTDDRFWQLGKVLAQYFLPCWQTLISTESTRINAEIVPFRNDWATI